MKKRYTSWLCFITGLSTVFCLAANLVSGRTGFFGPWVAPMGVFFFPFIYILSDVTSDVYGYRISRYIAWWTSLSNVLFTGLCLLIITVNTPAPWSVPLDEALKMILNTSVRVAIAGIIGAVLGGWTNDIIFQLFRHTDGTEHFIKRKLLSSLGAELVDTATFITLAFFGTPAWGIAMYVVQFILKYGVEVITSPLAKAFANNLRMIEGSDVFEDRNQFNIFGLERRVK